MRDLLSESDIDELGEAFEGEEHRRCGERGFESIVAEVATIEASLGIADLAAFNP